MLCRKEWSGRGFFFHEEALNIQQWLSVFSMSLQGEKEYDSLTLAMNRMSCDGLARVLWPSHFRREQETFAKVILNTQKIK